jgi:hypothetical protein
MAPAAMTNSGEPTAKRGASTERTRSELALVGPVERWRDEPHSAPTTEATQAA